MSIKFQLSVRMELWSISVPHKYLNKDIHADMKGENYSKKDKELFKQKLGTLQDELLNKTNGKQKTVQK